MNETRVKGYEFWVDRDLFEYCQFSHFTSDVLDGFGSGGLSLETQLSKIFKFHYRLFSNEELKQYYLHNSKPPLACSHPN